jgi:ABC-type transporter Mla subunit MlaD
MSGDAFQIDLDVVEASAQQIQRMLDDLQDRTARLRAVVQQITEVAYGTDPLGKALTGGSSGVGGLPQHQQQVLAGIEDYLQNTAAMAQNLLTMCQRYRATDEQHAAALRAIGGPDLQPPPEPVPTPTASTVAASTVAEPVTDPGWSTPTEVAYDDPDKPDLGPDPSEPPPFLWLGTAGGPAPRMV